MKKYIAEQRRIQAAIDSGNIQNSSNLLDGITSQPVDPFFNFIVRKMLTGSETGVLPSESLRSLLDELTKKTKQDIDTTVAVTRDELGRVISFDNYLRNKGSLRVDLLDERFTLETFNYVVNKGFNQLQDAVDAEKNVLRRAAELDTIFPDDATVTFSNGKSCKKPLNKDACPFNPEIASPAVTVVVITPGAVTLSSIKIPPEVS